MALVSVCPTARHFDLGGSSGVFGIGVGITAYTLGLRHAFDADHIGAIDNTTRKLMTDGQRPLSVGFFFSLGRSTIVFVLAAGFWDWLANLDFNLIGYFIVGLFVATWAVALAVWRFGRIEEKWTAHLRTSEPAA